MTIADPVAPSVQPPGGAVDNQAPADPPAVDEQAAPGRWQTTAAELRTPLYRNGLVLLCNSGMTSLLGLAYWALATHLASDQAVGVNSALIAAMVAVANICQYSLGGALTTYLPRLTTGASRLVRRVYLTSAAIGAAVAVGYVFIAPRVSRPLHSLSHAPLAIGFVAAVALWTVFGLQDCVFTGLRKTAWIPAENIAYSAVKVILVLALAGGVAGYGIFASWTIPAAVAIVPVSMLLFGRLLPAWERRPATPAPVTIAFTRFVAADGAGIVVSQLSAAALPLLIAARLGAADTGLFYIPWMLIQALDLLAINLGMSLTVEGAHIGSVPRPMLRRVMIRLLAIIVVLAAVVAVAAPELLRVFGSVYQHGSVTVLRVLLIAAAMKVVNIIAIAAYRAELAARRLVVLLAVPGLTLPVAAWFLMPRFGLVGPALAVILAELVGMAISLPGLGRPRPAS